MALTASFSHAQNAPTAWAEIPGLESLAAEDLPRLAEDFPQSSRIVRRQLLLAHQAGEAAEVRRLMMRMADLGGDLSDGSRASLQSHFAEDHWSAVERRMNHNRTPRAASTVRAIVPATVALVEGIATDPQSGTLYATSVADRALWRLSDDGWREIPLPADTGSLFGAAVDPVADMLWLVSGVADPTPAPETAFVGLIGYSLATEETVRIAAPDGARPGDIAVGSNGAIYISDTGNGAIYRAEDGGLSMFVAPGRFLSAQGLVVSPDNRSLYIADYFYGLARVDLESGEIFQLRTANPIWLDGIDGLVGDGETLIAIRNGTTPQSIWQLELNGDGTGIQTARLIEASHPEWGEPTLGVIAGNQLLYVSDAQWERYDENGRADPEIEPRPTPIRSVTLR
jgi:sugar lactone lactonase YvrE